MNNKEINFRSIIFLIIGIILILSLVIGIYILDSERDLVHLNVLVENVDKDYNEDGDNNVTVSYNVKDKKYNYEFLYDADINEGDSVDIYYHEKNVSDVQTYKTSKFILVSPILGLLLCIWGLVETFKKKDDDKDDSIYETQVLNVIDDNTKQLSIITDDESVSYEKLPEEEIESKIGIIKRDKKKVVKKKKEIKKIVPVSYYLTKNSVVYVDKKNIENNINYDDIVDIKKEYNKKDELISLVIVLKDMECHLNRVDDIDINKISVYLDNKLNK